MKTATNYTAYAEDPRDQSIRYRLQDGTEMTLAAILATFTDTDGDRVDDPQDIGALRGEDRDGFVTVTVTAPPS